MASAQLDQAMRVKIDTACTTAEEFTKLYYESVDKKRHQMSRLYMDNGVVVWNGNGANGKEQIEKFFNDLPRTEHTISTLDAQPIVDDSVSTQMTFLVQVSGTARLKDGPLKPFQQTFMITAQGDKWRIVSDCFRLQDGIF
ncbi:NTF2-related export protein [Anopheles aquasalis]|uniref:NTF2-related export protein n=3 Tax=Nyssorhynchus TaxID=44543 RepID=W5JTA9_ANODA|nr:NTF2-related export protein-like [Anopheles albimanus]XP_049534595.1 NTF2-related export protein [Anopheles darlingi]XP_050084577.1 NTF2-related export protein [Anopheles aquasalis]ETN67612.1 p15-2a protein [Anopheles darlingi]